MACPEKISCILSQIPSGSIVGVISFVGSFCPVTVAHIQCVMESYKILSGTAVIHRPSNLQVFDHIIALISVNSDSYVSSKLLRTKEQSISASDRKVLIDLATAEIPWYI